MEKKIIVICGHYGSGKTNIAINLALSFAEKGKKTVAVDLDTVNPYFRLADFSEMMKEKGIRVISVNFANTNLDVPSLPPDINSVFVSNEEIVIIDLGGDDAGAVAIGRFRKEIEKIGYEMYSVISMYRPFTANAYDVIKNASEIEAVTGLKISGFINNSSLGADTQWETVAESLEYAHKVSELSERPILFTSVTEDVYNKAPLKDGLYKINLYTKKLW